MRRAGCDRPGADHRGGRRTDPALEARAPNAIMARPPECRMGSAFVGEPHHLLGVSHTWEAGDVEAPSMMLDATGAWLFFSGNDWNGRSYAIGVVHCAGPLGPCDTGNAVPLLASHDTLVGPGGASVFQSTPTVNDDSRSTRTSEPKVRYPGAACCYIAKIDLRVRPTGRHRRIAGRRERPGDHPTSAASSFSRHRDRRPVRPSTLSAPSGRRRPALIPSQRKRFAFPMRRPVVDPGECGEFGLVGQDQIGERAAREVGGAHAVAHVAARPSESGGPVVAHRRVPITRHAERPSPFVGDPGAGDRGEQLDEHATQIGEHLGVAVELVTDAGVGSDRAHRDRRMRCGRRRCAARR